MVLHVLTVHWRSDAWIETQARALDQHLPAGSVRWGCLNAVPGDWAGRFDHVLELDGSHAAKLNEMAQLASAGAAPDDLLLFIDGDAFPVAPITADLLGGRPLAAVRRDENLGDPQPHPCFCLTTVETWAAIGGDWREGPTWINAQGDEVSDVGARLLEALRVSGTPWRPLLRTNTVDLHPLWFGVYGDVVYHHGAGFRPTSSRLDRVQFNRMRSGTVAERIPGVRRSTRLVEVERAGRRRASRELDQRGQARRIAMAAEVKSWIDAGGDVRERFTPSPPSRR